MYLDLADDKSTLVQVIAWCHQATSHYLNNYFARFCRHLASLGHKELMYILTIFLYAIYGTVCYPQLINFSTDDAENVWTLPHYHQSSNRKYDLVAFVLGDVMKLWYVLRFYHVIDYVIDIEMSLRITWHFFTFLQFSLPWYILITASYTLDCK